MKEIENDQQVWDLYANGITQGLNQCEKESTTAKCMQFKPKNIVELSMFIASIRPGFASMGPTFWSRTPFQYGIPSLDKLLRVNGVTGRIKDSAWLIFDEQILVCLQAGGVPGDVAYATIKYIKKKKRDKVLQVKEMFRKGFAEHLIKEEHVTEDIANDTVEKVWRIIEDSASYLEGVFAN